MLSITIIDGYLGRDPDKKEIQGNDGPFSRTTISVGVSRDAQDGKTDWFFCVFYGAKADAVEKWFRKGSRIKVVGRMESYPIENDPQRKAWKLVGDKYYFGDKKTSNDDASAASKQQDIGPLQEEDVPF